MDAVALFELIAAVGFASAGGFCLAFPNFKNDRRTRDDQTFNLGRRSTDGASK